MENSVKVIVAGGGAAGLMAAARAAELGAEVTLLERMDRPARKILLTGNGRCNVTTGHDVKTAIASFGSNGNFLYSAFSKFYATDMVELLEGLGVPLKMDESKRYFPESDKAADVVYALIKNAKEKGARIVTGCRVIRVETRDNFVTGVVVNEKDKEDAVADAKQQHYDADCVILATGGMSYPATGSTGDGYRLAGGLGHMIIEPRPALIPIELSGEIHREMSPLSFRDVKVGIQSYGKILAEESGDMMFTPFGATGPAVLNLGRTVSDTKDKSQLMFVVNFMPGLTEKQVDENLVREMNEGGGRSVRSILETMLPRRAVPVFLELAGLAGDKKGGEVSKADREKLRRLLTGFSLPVSGVRSLDEAVVTAGGVNLKEIHPGTLESKIVKGLYICGELLDLDAATGGFNLQCAFSTGRLAGESAATAD